MTYFRVSTANSYDATISRINQRSAELTATQEKLSAGKRVLKASDDPVAATLAERESNRLMRTEADLRALERSRSSLQQAESTVGQMGDVLARFKELLVQGGNSTLTASDRRSLAQEMRGLREQLLNLANTQDSEGNALLGGLGTLNGSGKPFADVFPGGVQYQAIEGQQAATETGLPNRVDGGFLAGGASAPNLFQSLQLAIDTLEDPSVDAATLTAQLGQVHDEMQIGQDRLLLLRGRLGELLLRADSVEGLLQDRSVAGQQELANLTDLDMVKAISQFQTQQLGLQAALQSYAQVQRLSLFQYIA